MLMTGGMGVVIAPLQPDRLAEGNHLPFGAVIRGCEGRELVGMMGDGNHSYLKVRGVRRVIRTGGAGHLSFPNSTGCLRGGTKKKAAAPQGRRLFRSYYDPVK